MTNSDGHNKVLITMIFPEINTFFFLVPTHFANEEENY